MNLSRLPATGLLMFAMGHAFAADQPLDWQLIGTAQLSVMFFDIYESRLYTTTGEYTQGQLPVRLDIRYQRDIAREKLVEHTRKEWRHLNMPPTRIQQWAQQLQALWPNVASGDLLSLTVDANGRGTFSHNGGIIGKIDSPHLTSSFLDIWLSPNTSRPEHRQQLLKGTSDD